MYIKKSRLHLGILTSYYVCLEKCVCVCTQSCPTLCNPMDCSPPGSSVHGILQARTLEWIVISFSRGSSQSRESNPHLLHCRQILYQLSHLGRPCAWRWRPQMVPEAPRGFERGHLMLHLVWGGRVLQGFSSMLHFCTTKVRFILGAEDLLRSGQA